MTKRNNPIPPRDTQNELEFKDEFRDQYRKKKQTQRAASERRKFIRELKEERDWN
jgi:hypothetical protein